MTFVNTRPPFRSVHSVALDFLPIMESLLSLLRMHWDHEPFQTPGQGTRPTSSRPGALTGRFMESEHLQNLDVSWGHEPFSVASFISNALRVRFTGSGPGPVRPRSFLAGLLTV